MTLGPDATRYMAVAEGIRVSRPFNVRRLWPTVCGTSPKRWWVVWLASWPAAGIGFVLWRHASGDSWMVAVTGAVLLLSLPGVLGPSVVIPIGVDLPTLAVSMVGCWVFTISPGAGCLVFVVAAAGKESVPLLVALWLWNPLPLITLIVPAVTHILCRPGPDPLGPKFDHIAAHPIRSAFASHQGRWRDGWLMVAPWGVCLIVLYQPPLQVVVVLVVAYAQLLIATDTVRVYQYAAAPVVAFTAAHIIPPQWAPAACVAQLAWWWNIERI